MKKQGNTSKVNIAQNIEKKYGFLKNQLWFFKTPFHLGVWISKKPNWMFKHPNWMFKHPDWFGFLNIQVGLDF